MIVPPSTPTAASSIDKAPPVIFCDPINGVSKHVPAREVQGGYGQASTHLWNLSPLHIFEALLQKLHTERYCPDRWVGTHAGCCARTSAWNSMAGIAMLPTAVKPVKNLPASIQLHHAQGPLTAGLDGQLWDNDDIDMQESS